MCNNFNPNINSNASLCIYFFYEYVSRCQIVRVGVRHYLFVHHEHVRPWLIYAYKNVKGRGTGKTMGKLNEADDLVDLGHVELPAYYPHQTDDKPEQAKKVSFPLSGEFHTATSTPQSAIFVERPAESEDSPAVDAQKRRKLQEDDDKDSVAEKEDVEQDRKGKVVEEIESVHDGVNNSETVEKAAESPVSHRTRRNSHRECLPFMTSTPVASSVQETSQVKLPVERLSVDILEDSTASVEQHEANKEEEEVNATKNDENNVDKVVPTVEEGTFTKLIKTPIKGHLMRKNSAKSNISEMFTEESAGEDMDEIQDVVKGLIRHEEEEEEDEAEWDGGEVVEHDSSEDEGGIDESNSPWPKVVIQNINEGSEEVTSFIERDRKESEDDNIKLGEKENDDTAIMNVINEILGHSSESSVQDALQEVAEPVASNVDVSVATPLRGKRVHGSPQDIEPLQKRAREESLSESVEYETSCARTTPRTNMKKTAKRVEDVVSEAIEAELTTGDQKKSAKRVEDVVSEAIEAELTTGDQKQIIPIIETTPKPKMDREAAWKPRPVIGTLSFSSETSESIMRDEKPSQDRLNQLQLENEVILSEVPAFELMSSPVRCKEENPGSLAMMEASSLELMHNDSSDEDIDAAFAEMVTKSRSSTMGSYVSQVKPEPPMQEMVKHEEPLKEEHHSPPGPPPVQRLVLGSKLRLGRLNLPMSTGDPFINKELVTTPRTSVTQYGVRIRLPQNAMQSSRASNQVLQPAGLIPSVPRFPLPQQQQQQQQQQILHRHEQYASTQVTMQVTSSLHTETLSTEEDTDTNEQGPTLPLLAQCTAPSRYLDTSNKSMYLKSYAKTEQRQEPSPQPQREPSSEPQEEMELSVEQQALIEEQQLAQQLQEHEHQFELQQQQHNLEHQFQQHQEILKHQQQLELQRKQLELQLQQQQDLQMQQLRRQHQEQLRLQQQQTMQQQELLMNMQQHSEQMQSWTTTEDLEPIPIATPSLGEEAKYNEVRDSETPSAANYQEHYHKEAAEPSDEQPPTRWSVQSRPLQTYGGRAKLKPKPKPKTSVNEKRRIVYTPLGNREILAEEFIESQEIKANGDCIIVRQKKQVSSEEEQEEVDELRAIRIKKQKKQVPVSLPPPPPMAMQSRAQQAMNSQPNLSAPQLPHMQSQYMMPPRMSSNMRHPPPQSGQYSLHTPLGNVSVRIPSNLLITNPQSQHANKTPMQGAFRPVVMQQDVSGLGFNHESGHRTLFPAGAPPPLARGERLPPPQSPIRPRFVTQMRPQVLNMAPAHHRSLFQPPPRGMNVRAARPVAKVAPGRVLQTMKVSGQDALQQQLHRIMSSAQGPMRFQLPPGMSLPLSRPVKVMSESEAQRLGVRLPGNRLRRPDVKPEGDSVKMEPNYQVDGMRDSSDSDSSSEDHVKHSDPHDPHLCSGMGNTNLIALREIVDINVLKSVKQVSRGEDANHVDQIDGPSDPKEQSETEIQVTKVIAKPKSNQILNTTTNRVTIGEPGTKMSTVETESEIKPTMNFSNVSYQDVQDDMAMLLAPSNNPLRDIPDPHHMEDWRHKTKTDQNTYQRVRLVSRPWKTPEGTVNRPTLRMMLSAVMTYIMSKPGVSLDGLEEKYERVLQPVPLLELIEMLILLGCVKMLQLKDKPRSTLFSKRIPVELASEEEEIPTQKPVFLPTVDCLIKFGQFEQHLKGPSNG